MGCKCLCTPWPLDLVLGRGEYVQHRADAARMWAVWKHKGGILRASLAALRAEDALLALRPLRTIRVLVLARQGTDTARCWARFHHSTGVSITFLFAPDEALGAVRVCAGDSFAQLAAVVGFLAKEDRVG